MISTLNFYRLFFKIMFFEPVMTWADFFLSPKTIDTCLVLRKFWSITKFTSIKLRKFNTLNIIYGNNAVLILFLTLAMKIQ